MRRVRRAVTNILALVGLWFVLVVFTPVVPWWAKALAGPWAEPRGEVLIVLGSDAGFGMVGEGSYWRVFYARRTLEQGGWQEVVLSGGAGVAEAMRDLLVVQGAPAPAIRLETRSRSTRENALFTAEMLAGDPRRKVLLTSDFHVFRSIRAFRKAGLVVTSLPVPHVLKRANIWWLRPGLFVDLMVETTKIAYYRWKGWI